MSRTKAVFGPAVGFAVDDCHEAMVWYKKAFNATKKWALRHNGKTIAHVGMQAYGASFMFWNNNPDWKSFSPKHHGGITTVQMTFYVHDVDKAFKSATDAGARSLMPPADCFWGERFAKVSDPWGHHWSFAKKTKELTEAQVQKGWDDFMKNAIHHEGSNKTAMPKKVGEKSPKQSKTVKKGKK
jgi:uncharacterized glyoxalase superfamily protein PhnB